MFSVFINTLNEKRTVLSFLCSAVPAVAAGRTGQLWGQPWAPSTLPRDVAPWQHHGPQRESGWRTCPSKDHAFESLAPRWGRDMGLGGGGWGKEVSCAFRKAKASRFFHLAPGSPDERSSTVSKELTIVCAELVPPSSPGWLLNTSQLGLPPACELCQCQEGETHAAGSGSHQSAYGVQGHLRQFGV